MDGVGATSSITSLVDLGKRLYDFWKAIEDAPGEIQEIKETVISLKSIIDEIANQYNGLLAPFRSIEQVLEQAKNKVQELLKYLETIDIGRSSVRRRKWASIKAALRQEKVAKFRAGMESTKASLILAQSLILSDKNSKNASLLVERIDRVDAQQARTISSLLVAQTQLSDLQQHIEEVHSEIFHICMAQSGSSQASFIQPAMEAMARTAVRQILSETNFEPTPASLESLQGGRKRVLRRCKYNRCYSTIFGNVYCYTRVVREETNEIHIDTSIKIIPAPWLSSYCLTISKAKANQNLAWTLRPTPLRKRESPIFMFSGDGNIAAVQTLLQSGQASPWDTDPWGWTPLHHAARWGRHQMCSFLIQSGADVDAVAHDSDIHWRREPFYSYQVESVNQLETLRVLVDQGRPEVLPERFPYCPSSPAKTWLLSKEARYLDNLDGLVEDWPFLFSFILIDRNIQNIDILVRNGHDINERISTIHDDFHGWTTLHFEFYNDYGDQENYPLLEYLLRKGAAIHGITSDGESPTSLAMDHPLKFHRWVQVLCNQKDFNVDDFCSKELANWNLLRSRGWEKKSLRKLFTTHISRLKCQYDQFAPESEVGGYITWWENRLRSCNRNSSERHRLFDGSLSDYRKSRAYYLCPRKLVWGTGGGFDIVCVRRWEWCMAVLMRQT